MNKEKIMIAAWLATTAYGAWLVYKNTLGYAGDASVSFNNNGSINGEYSKVEKDLADIEAEIQKATANTTVPPTSAE